MNLAKTSRDIKDTQILKTFGMEIKKRRESLGYTQENFSLFVGFSRSYYAEIENGKRNISLLNLIKILRALKIDASSIIDPIIVEDENKEV